MPDKESLELPVSFKKRLAARKIDTEFLITRLEREFNAKERKTIKVRGAVKQEDLPEGYKIIAQSGTLGYDKEGGQVFGDGETIIQYDEWLMGIQQNARKDTHKLRRDYPVEKVDHTGGIIVNIKATPIKKTKKEE